jgi:ADP-ribose pyrophosphatase YjhB (NUDIX family)
MSLPTTILCSACVLDQAGVRLLIVAYGDDWGLPEGMLCLGETLEDALVLIVFEATGYMVRVDTCTHVLMRSVMATQGLTLRVNLLAHLVHPKPLENRTGSTESVPWFCSISKVKEQNQSEHLREVVHSRFPDLSNETAQLRNRIVTIDGSAGAGKGTIAARLAESLGFAYLETGMVYRGITHAFLVADITPHDPQLVKLLKTLQINFLPQGLCIDGVPLAEHDLKLRELMQRLQPILYYRKSEVKCCAYSRPRRKLTSPASWWRGAILAVKYFRRTMEVLPLCDLSDPGDAQAAAATAKGNPCDL